MDGKRKEEALAAIRQMLGRHPGNGSQRSDSVLRAYYSQSIQHLLSVLDSSTTQLAVLADSMEQSVERWKRGASLPPKTKLRKLLDSVSKFKEDEAVEENAYEQAKELLEEALRTYPSGSFRKMTPADHERLRIAMTRALGCLANERRNLCFQTGLAQQSLERWMRGTAVPRRKSFEDILSYVNQKLNPASSITMVLATTELDRFKTYVCALACIEDPQPDDFQRLAQIESVIGPLGEEALAAILRDKHRSQNGL